MFRRRPVYHEGHEEREEESVFDKGRLVIAIACLSGRRCHPLELVLDLNWINRIRSDGMQSIPYLAVHV